MAVRCPRQQAVDCYAGPRLKQRLEQPKSPPQFRNSRSRAASPEGQGSGGNGLVIGKQHDTLHETGEAKPLRCWLWKASHNNSVGTIDFYDITIDRPYPRR